MISQLNFDSLFQTFNII